MRWLLGVVVMASAMTTRAEEGEIHRVGVNLTVLAQLQSLGALRFPTVSCSAALPW